MSLLKLTVPWPFGTQFCVCNNKLTYSAIFSIIVTGKVIPI